MKRQCITMMTIAALILGGCQAGTFERSLLRCEPNRRAVVRQAPYDGEYRLYSGAAAKPTTQATAPIRSDRLKHGESIGFARDATGQLVAVVREERVSLEPSATYTWTVQPDPGQIDGGKTLLFVVVVGVAVGIGVAAAVAANSASNFSGLTFSPQGP